MRVVPLLCLLSIPAFASIPEFSADNPPEVIKKDPNPKAREFWRDLVEDAKKGSRQMFKDTKKTTGLRESDMKKTDWLCLFWRYAATQVKNVQRRFPGLQPPEFADFMDRTALDKDDCPDEGGPGSYGVRVYNTAINQVMAGRGGWQMSALPEPSSAPVPRDEMPGYARLTRQALQAFIALGIGVESAAESVSNFAVGASLPVIIIPREMIDKLDPKKHQNPGSL